MKLLIDTHIFLWALSEPEKIGIDRIRELENPANLILVSAISIAEIMIKSSIGKLEVPFDPLEMVEKSGFDHLPFTADSAVLLGSLPWHHKDPFDRMLITQALSMNIPIMTDDGKFAPYSCRLM